MTGLTFPKPEHADLAVKALRSSAAFLQEEVDWAKEIQEDSAFYSVDGISITISNLNRVAELLEHYSATMKAIDEEAAQ